MFVATSRVIFYALGAFTVGAFIGYVWRENITVPTIRGRMRLAHLQKRVTDSVVIQSADDEDERLNRLLSSQGSEGTCVPQPNVMFMKTHKTASSAVQNVLLRYADKHGLTVGLSNLKDIRFHYGQKFHKEFVAPTKYAVNMLCHHMVFNYDELVKVMPANATYVTIIREPGSMFESLFDYMHYDSKPFAKVKKQPNALEFWLNHTDMFFHGRKDGHFWWFAKNALFYDLGYDNLKEDDGYIQQAIDELDKHFDLVLIADYFDESMLLLKDKLCWSMNDILALKTNARNAARTVVTERLTKRIRAWNKADAAVYDHFNRTFWKKVADYGHERMRVDLKLLEEMNAQIYENCIQGGPVSNKFIEDPVNKVYNPRGVVMTGYNLKESAKSNSTCLNLLKGEIQWTRQMMARNKVT